MTFLLILKDWCSWISNESEYKSRLGYWIWRGPLPHFTGNLIICRLTIILFSPTCHRITTLRLKNLTSYPFCFLQELNMVFNACIILLVLILKVILILPRCSLFWYYEYCITANVLWNSWLSTILHKHYFGVLRSSKTTNGSEWRGRKWWKRKIEKTTNYQYTERGSSSISFNNLSHWKAWGSLKMEICHQGPLTNMCKLWMNKSNMSFHTELGLCKISWLP